MCHHTPRDEREVSSERRTDEERSDERDRGERADERERSPVGDVVRTPVRAVRRAVAAVTP